MQDIFIFSTLSISPVLLSVKNIVFIILCIMLIFIFFMCRLLYDRLTNVLFRSFSIEIREQLEFCEN